MGDDKSEQFRKAENPFAKANTIESTPVGEGIKRLAEASPTTDDRAAHPSKKSCEFNNEDMLRRILDGIQSNQQVIEALNRKFIHLEETFKKERELDRQRIEKLDKEVSNLKKENEELKGLIVSEDRMRRKNRLVVSGLEESREEDTSGRATEESARRFFSEKFGESLEIKSAVRVGRREDSKPRRLLVKMKYFEDKIKILKGKRNALRGTKIYINEDLSREDYKREKFLSGKAREARQKGERVKIRKNGLQINDKFYRLHQIDGNLILSEPKN